MDGSPILKYPCQSVSAQAIRETVRQNGGSICVTAEQIRDLLGVTIAQLQTHIEVAEYMEFENADDERTEVAECLESLDGVLEKLQRESKHIHVRAESASLRAMVAAISNSKDTAILRDSKPLSNSGIMQPPPRSAIGFWSLCICKGPSSYSSSSPQTTLEEYLAMRDSDYSVALRYLKQASGRASPGIHPFTQSHMPEHSGLFNATFSSSTAYSRLQQDALFAKLLDRLRIKCSASNCSSDIMSPDTKLKLCSQCRSTRYCSSACQQYSWKHEFHNLFCRSHKLHEVGDIVQIDSGIHEVRIEVDAASVVLCLLGDTVRHVVIGCDAEIARLVSVQERNWVLETALDEWIRWATHMEGDELDRIRKETQGLDATQADEYYRRNLMDTQGSV
ncbi:hypothetical protein HDU81_008527 [Chytriomyces hyalinus]|nr:hypothetical protein HDU81_008527 [Chytriomyces hyalinus]